MPTLQKANGTREFQDTFLNQISFRLLTSDMSYQKENDLVYYLLDSNGRLLTQQVAPQWSIGQSLFEQFIPRWSANRPFNLAYYAKQGGSLVGGIAEALSSVGAGSLSSLQSLDDVYALIHSQPIPSASRYFTIMDDSSNVSLNLTRNHKTFQDRNFYDLSHEEVPHNFKLIRNHISNYYEAGISLNNVPCNSIQVQGLDVVQLGNDEFRLGPVSVLAPVISLSVSNPHTVEALAGQTLNAPSATAVDFQGNSQTVTVNPASIDLGTLGPINVVYSCTTSTGELASLNLVINRVDTTSPQLLLLANSERIVNFEVELNGTFSDPGATASDLVDGDLSSQIQVSGTVDTSVAAVYTLNYSVVDSSNLGAQAVRSITVKEPYLFFDSTTYTSAAVFASGLGTSLTSQPDQLSLGVGHGFSISFDWKSGSDTTGVIFAILDNTRPSGQQTQYGTPESDAAFVFRRAGSDLQVVCPAYFSTAIRYFTEPTRGSAGWWHSQVYPQLTGWNLITLRIWDKDQSNWGFFFHSGASGLYGSGGTGGHVADIPKSPGFPHANHAPYLGRTSTWSGYSVLGIPNNNSGASWGGAAPGEIITSGSFVLTDDQIRNILITTLDRLSDHTIAP